MREQLKNINGVRKRFIATFSRYGSKAGYEGRTVKTLLFVNVRDAQGQVYCDHIWFTRNKQFDQMGLEEGDNICFDARVREYWKGYYPERKRDFRLSHPNNIVKSGPAGAQGLLF